MGSVSSVPAVKQALLETLRARPALAQVSVVYGPPLFVGDNDYVWLGELEGEQSYSALNATTRPRDERYTLDVIINVKRAGDDTQVATERCFELMGELESELVNDPSVHGALTPPGRAEIGRFKLVENLADDGAGRVSELTVAVDVFARLRR